MGLQRSLGHFCFKPLQYGCLRTPKDPSNQDIRFDIYVWVPVLQIPGEPEQAGEARRADSASARKKL